MPTTIDMTPTWSEILGMLLTGFENGNATGRKIALDELRRMADLADCASIIMGAHRRPDAPEIPEAQAIKARLESMSAIFDADSQARAMADYASHPDFEPLRRAIAAARRPLDSIVQRNENIVSTESR